ncbi:response regulator transcription factor [Peptoniphilus sp. KCTC 25270]|uniref:response regulator transcription factor n=1 Tax=Peptoniphilus sp. KCTC 25270 TaxID=2897414 RepID=UPI001E2FC2DC|nr:response regulator transcription factor [Peptoniphilus sp. KCTC 25270]MCD1147687.1 response regulator transcription factor [Peptoniphilus sp. KCTC 25270]
MRILVVEDEKELRKSIVEGLRLQGYSVDEAEDGEMAEEILFVENYDLMILDINLPKLDGFTLLKRLREENQEIQVIVLTARSHVEDRVEGLDLGANDYLTKPFYFEELMARIRSLFRRKYIVEESMIKVGNLEFDTVSRSLFLEGEEIKLTGKETSIFEYLILNRGSFVTSETLMEHVWDGEADPFSNAVRVHISSLRKKIKGTGEKDPIRNEIGKGYIIDEEISK